MVRLAGRRLHLVDVKVNLVWEAKAAPGVVEGPQKRLKHFAVTTTP